MACLLSFSIFFIAHNHYFQKWNWILNDHTLYGDEIRPSSDIVIVGIDDKSLSDEGLGRWQDWERGNYADLIEKLEENKAAVIGIDILFSERSHNQQQDQKFAKILNKYENIVIGQENAEIEVVPEIKKDDASIGIVKFTMDADQILRRVQFSFPDTDYDHFSIAILKKYLNLNTKQSFIDLENNQYVLSNHPIRVPGTSYQVSKIPLDQTGRAYVNFFGPAFSYKYLSFVDVVQGKINPEDIEGKIVLIGPSAESLQDLKNVPFSNQPMPGVEVHASIIQTILEGKFLAPQDALQELISIVLAVFISCFLFYALTPLRATISFILIFFAIVALWAEKAPEMGTIVNIFYIILGVALSYITIFVFRYATVEKARRRIEKVFSTYVSKDVVAEIKSHPEMLHLGGEKRVMTAFFSDIAGFTTISEKISPEELVSLLNEYFEMMTEILFKYGGTLDKYEGDAIMAFWNAPTIQEDHAKRGCMTALEMQASLRKMRKKWAQEGKPAIRVRMGLNTGDMIVGNVGSKDRFDYTIMGDAVNLSSRLEGANKFYGTEIMITESTYQEIKNSFEVRELDLLKVKGKAKAVRVYELLSQKGKLPKIMQQILPHYKAGIEAYYQKKWDYALTHFNKILEIRPSDEPTNLHVARCQVYKVKPPSEDWDGSFELTEK